MCQPSHDPVAQARNALAAWRAYYDWMLARLPEHGAVIKPEAFARSALRMSLHSAEALLGEGIVARMRHEVLGDALTLACKSCGAVLDASDAMCRFCGAGVRVETDDPWVTHILEQWAQTEERLLNEGKLHDAPFAAIQITLFAASTGTGKVVPHSAVRVLARIIPWVPKTRLLEAIHIVEGSMPPAARDVIGQMRPMIEASWTEDASKRPVAKKPTAGPAEHASAPNWSADNDPWIQTTLANLRLGAPNGASVGQLVGLCLMPFQTGSRLAPAQALALFQRVTPKPNRQKLLEHIGQMRMVYGSNPAILEFLDALKRGIP
jgi:hypothetical protein